MVFLIQDEEIINGGFKFEVQRLTPELILDNYI